LTDTPRAITKDIDYYMSLPYTIELTPDEDGWWFAQIPLLKGCMTNGDGILDTMEMIEDAKRAWITVALEREMEIPEPDIE